MTIIKSNNCKQCGGPLDIDLDRQVYLCPYCGVTYDYEYFREDNVKEIARKSVVRREFGAAKDAYDFMLAKDPHDFDALLGMFLSDIKWQSIHPILNHNNVSFPEDNKKLAYAIENCMPGDKGYFEKIKECAQLAEKYRENRRELGKLDGIKETQQTVVIDLGKEELYNERAFSIFWEEFSELPGLKGGISLVFDLAVILLLALGICIYYQAWGMLVMAAVPLVIGVLIYNIRKVIVRHAIRADMGPAKAQLEKCVEDCNNKIKEGTEILKKYREVSQAINEEHPSEKPAEIKE